MTTDTVADVRPINKKEITIVEGYLSNGFNKTKAVRNAGISEHTAMQQSWQIFNRPQVKEYLEKRLSELTISKSESIKLISDIATSNLSDYFRPRQQIHIPKIKKGLAELIKDYQYTLELEGEFADKKGLTEEQFDKFHEGLEWRRDQIIKWQIELRKNPLASRIVDGEPELITVMDLDINEIIADKERGKIKSVKYTKEGIQIEGYSALDANDKLLRVHGAYEKDNEQQRPDSDSIMKVQIVQPLPDDE